MCGGLGRRRPLAHGSLQQRQDGAGPPQHRLGVFVHHVGLVRVVLPEDPERLGQPVPGLRLVGKAPGSETDLSGQASHLGVVGDRDRGGASERRQDGPVQPHVERHVAPPQGRDHLPEAEAGRGDVCAMVTHLLGDPLTTPPVVELIGTQFLHGNEQDRSPMLLTKGVQGPGDVAFPFGLDLLCAPGAGGHGQQGSGKVGDGPVHLRRQVDPVDQPGGIPHHRGIGDTERLEFRPVGVGAYGERRGDLGQRPHPQRGAGIEERSDPHPPHQDGPPRRGRSQRRSQIAGNVRGFPAEDVLGSESPLIRQESPATHDHHPGSIRLREDRRNVGPVHRLDAVGASGVLRIAGRHSPPAVWELVPQEGQHPG